MLAKTAAWTLWVTVMVLITGAATVLILRQQGMELLSVQSGSMAPAVDKGDAVLLAKRFDGLRRGDIVTFRSPGNPDVLVTHRIVAIDAARDSIIAKGDAATRNDEPVGQAQLVGRVEHVVPFAGYGLDFFRSPAGLAAVVYLPAGLIVAGEAGRLSRYYASRRYRLHGYHRFQRGY